MPLEFIRWILAQWLVVLKKWNDSADDDDDDDINDNDKRKITLGSY